MRPRQEGELKVLEERFDVLDCRGEKTGETAGRNDAHRLGLWHGSFHCVIVARRQGSGSVLFQKRSQKKKIAPGKYDVSVGGHLAAGEDVRAAAPREIREELGLDVGFSELLHLGRRVFVYCFDTAVRECEFQEVFLLDREVNPEALVLQREEVDGVIELGIEQGISLLSGKVHHIELPLVRPGSAFVPVRLRADDFVPSLDQYYLKLLLLARRYLKGEPILLI